MTSHGLDTEQQHKLRVRGANGGKLQTSLVVSTILERSDKSTATKLMKKRAKSFSKKDIKRSLSKARSSLSQFKDKKKDSLNAAPNSGSASSLNNSAELASVTDTVSSGENCTNLKQTHDDRDPVKYRVSVQVLECGNLCGKGSKQLFDTYVKLKVGELENKTRIQKKNVNPKFDESFEFDLIDLTEPLRVRVRLT